MKEEAPIDTLARVGWGFFVGGNMIFPKPTRWQSKKYRDAAKGQICTMQIDGICNGNTETTVLAHRNGGGMGTKHSDYDAADMCSACHDAYDGRVVYGYIDTYSSDFLVARYKTIINRIDRGILK